jgi:predicted N-acetyltransferase YhbS
VPEPQSRPTIECRLVTRAEVHRLAEIDRSEVVERIYYLRDGRLTLEPEHWDVPDWSPEEKRSRIDRLRQQHDEGCTLFGAFDADALVGLAVLDPRALGTGQRRLNLAGLWVSRAYRNRGIGRLLFQQAADTARGLGAKSLYVSATPSENTVRFYMSQGCRPANPVDPALLRAEPEDIHLELELLSCAPCDVPTPAPFDRA